MASLLIFVEKSARSVVMTGASAVATTVSVCVLTPSASVNCGYTADLDRDTGYLVGREAVCRKLHRIGSRLEMSNQIAANAVGRAAGRRTSTKIVSRNASVWYHCA